MNAKTEGELLFEQYLTEHGHTDFKYEEPIAGSTAVPDYQLPWNPKPLLFEIKGFDVEAPTGAGWFDPYPPIRRKIDKAKEKFRKLEGHSCSLVLQYSGPGLIVLDPMHIYGAMLGNLAISVPLDMDGRGDSDSARSVFGSGGRMIKYGKGAVPEEAMNTKINAIIVVEHYSPGRRLFDRDVSERKTQLGRNLTVEEIVEQLKVADGTEKDPSKFVVRVVVHENPYAAVPLTHDLFTGKYDERYGVDDKGRVHRMYAGTFAAKYDEPRM